MLLIVWALVAPLQADERPVLLVLGDSLSAAYGIAEDDGWVALLQRRLDTEGHDYRVVNASVSGETTDGGLARLPRALDVHRPSIVVVELGANDGLRGISLGEMRRNLLEITELSQASGARVLLVGMHLPPNYGPAYTERFHATFREVAVRKRIPLVPFLLDGVGTERSLMQDDGLHPTAAAQPRLLENVWVQLAPILTSEGRKLTARP
ncbi:MAG: arylesterase [Chromatiales bacterium]|jgi:acyl-CoA thioesterase-1